MRGRIVSVAVAPSVSPVSLAEMNEHLRFTGSMEDRVIQGLIDAAAASVSGELGRAIAPQTMREALQYPTRDTYLSVPPAQALVSVDYYDAANVLQAADLGDFEFYASEDWAFVRSDAWPATYDRPDAVILQYDVGSDDMPPDIIQALKLIVAHWFQNREATSENAVKEIPRGASDIIGLHRVGWYG